jgi:hypothetical protein
VGGVPFLARSQLLIFRPVAGTVQRGAGNPRQRRVLAPAALRAGAVGARCERHAYLRRRSGHLAAT